MERFDEGTRTTGKFNWSRSAFANAASKVSTQSIQSTAELSRARTPPTDGKVAATLAVDPELGAGLEVEFVEGRGYRVESIRPSPGQPSMRVGDLLVEVNGRSLALTNEDDADEVLANELRHGVPLLLERLAEDEPLEVAPEAAEVAEMAPASDMVPETSKLAFAEKPAEDPPAPRSLAGLLNSLFGAPKGGQSDSAEDPAGLASREKQPQGDSEWSSPENVEDDKEDDVEIVAPVWPEVEEEEKPQETVAETVEEDEEVMVFQQPEAKEDPWLHSDPWQAAFSATKTAMAEMPKEAEIAEAELEAAPESPSPVEVPAEAGGEQPHAAAQPDPEGSKPEEAQDPPEDLETADAVPSTSTASAPKEGNPPRRSTVRCKVADLEEWLQELRLEEYVDAAAKWCADMGAVSLEEIAENIEDFGVDISLKPIERQRVQKWAAQQLQGAVPLQKLAIEEPSRPSRGVARGPVAQRSLPGLWNDSERDWEGERVEREHRAETPVYTARSVRLAVDSQGNTGLDLRFDEDWGIRVQSVDPLPGQPGLAEGDFIVAIDGCSLRHRSHEECDQVFSERLQNGAILSVVRCSAPRESHTSVLAQSAAGYSRKTDLVPNWRLPRPDFRNSPNWSRQRRGGHDANRMWNRFSHRPPW